MVRWLRSEIGRLCGNGVDSIAVLTHHTPAMSGTSHPRFEGENANNTQHAFSTDMSALYSTAPELKVWAFGHTHFNADFVDGGTRLLSNQRGYAHEVAQDYDPGLCFSVCAEPRGEPLSRRAADDAAAYSADAADQL